MNHSSDTTFLDAIKLLSNIREDQILHSGNIPSSKQRKNTPAKNIFDQIHVSHPHIEICMNLAGKALLTLRDVPITLEQGELLIIRPDEKHMEGKINAKTPYTLLWIVLSRQSTISFLNSYLPKKKKWVASNRMATLSPCPKKLIKVLQNTKKQICSQDITLLRDCLLANLGIANRDLHLAKSLNNASPNAAKIQAVKAYIEHHYNEDITIDDLIYLTGFSPCYLYRLFRKFTGQSIHTYQTSCRMKQANKMLADGQMVKTVSSKIGYKNPLYFSRVYSKIFGYPPSAEKAK